MSTPALEKRRLSDFKAELYSRARAWIPQWSLADGERDFGRALLGIAARYSAEVAERLDQGATKMALGLLDWLAVRGKAAQPARLPVVFKLRDTAPATLAPAPVRLQASAAGATVIFETEHDVRVLPGKLDQIVGVNLKDDAFFLPPPGLPSLEQQPPLPTQWRLKSFAAAGSRTLQLDPALGLQAGTILEIAGAQYSIEKFENEIATIDPSLVSGVDTGVPVRKVTAFLPFDGARNRQRHVLYLGDAELLNLDAPATVEVVGAQALQDARWEYWGLGADSAEAGWQRLEPLAPTPGAAALKKPTPGAVEPRKIGKTESRWIRAWVERIDGCAPKLVTDSLGLKINATPAAAAVTPPALEIFVNSIPDATTRFFPLGRLPRMFDTLYLGCAEGFSKPRAAVDVQFELADMIFSAMSALQTSGGVKVLCGVDKAGTLQLFEILADGTLKPLFGHGPLQPGDAANVTLTSSGIRPAMWEAPNGVLHVAVAAGEEVWVWHQYLGNPNANAWESFRVPPPGNGPADAPVDGLALVDGAALTALRGGKLFARSTQSGGMWTAIPVTDAGGNTLDMEAIAPVRDDAGVTLDELIGVATNAKLYAIAAGGAAEELLDDVAADVLPCARKKAGQRYVAAASADHGTLRARAASARDIPLPDAVSVSRTALDAAFENGDFAVYALAPNPDATANVLIWLPFNADFEKLVFRVPGNPGAGMPAGAVTAYGNRLYVPGMLGEVLALSFAGSRVARSAQRSEFFSAFVKSALPPTLAVDDTVTAFDGDGYPLGVIIDGPKTVGSSHYYYLDDWLDVDAMPGDCEVFRTSAPASSGTPDATDQTLQLAAGDTVELDDLILVVMGGTNPNLVFRALSAGANPKLESVPDGTNLPAGPVAYWLGQTVQGRIAPALELDASNNTWDAGVLSSQEVLFPDLAPQRQRAVAVEVDSLTNHPLVIAFTEAWESLPAGAIEFVVDAKIATWRSLIGDTASNPDLSWEYWDGSGWAKLGVSDGTLNLKHGGKVRFSVPPDLKPTDWAGKTNYWIRARLVGGDYGQEEFKSETIGGVTTVQRSVAGIRPPFALSVSVRYALDNPVPPAHLFTEDSGSTRDQSDANRVSGARVEIFTPLCAALARLDGEEAPPATPAPKWERALYLGFDAELSGAPVNVLLLVESERPHEQFAPIEVATLIGNRFQPLVVEDKTRALGESGMLRLAFPVKPTRNELFGKSRAWLRLTPKTAASGAEWLPRIRGVYLNAAWARAAETLTRELLGSSEGMPRLRLQLARPPVLEGSLELRVREPLGEEERRALRASDPLCVLSDVESLPGDWVLWKQVPDTDDRGSTERVYMLHEETGIVRFGDGLHGAIPPVGRDSIVAFTYQRTEPPVPDAEDVPANSVQARDVLGLVSAVAGVETVVAAEPAAGGLPPERSERVLRFGATRLRHRGRAVTAHDFEDLTLERFVNVAQARCLPRPGGLRLVVVMRGRDPRPSAGFTRELKRVLLESAASWLGTPGVLEVRGPRVRRLRIALTLKVASLDDAGGVSESAEQKIRSLFDTASGGEARLGWPLGADPSVDNIAAALLDVPKLQAIADIELREVQRDGTGVPWRGGVKPTELVMLADDALLVTFEPLPAGS